jgi:hypothetical protein
MQNGLKVLTEKPWINMCPVFELMSVEELQEFLSLHQATDSLPFQNVADGTGQMRPNNRLSSDSSLSQYQSEQKRVKPSNDVTTDDYTKTAIMAQIFSCRYASCAFKLSAEMLKIVFIKFHGHV